MSWKNYNVHRRLREQYRPAVEAGEAHCVRCLLPIAPRGEPCPKCGRATTNGDAKNGRCGWDLDHIDLLAPEEREDVRNILGPSHACCNRRTGARNAARRTNRQKRTWSRDWLVD